MKKKVLAISFITVFIFVVVWLIVEGSKPEVLPIGSKLPQIKIKGFNETGV